MNPIEVYIASMKAICPEIEDGHLVELKKALEVKTYGKGEVIFEYQAKHNAVFYVVNGLVRTFYVNDKGDEKNAWFVQEQEFVTDYPCFLNAEKSNYTFQCIEDTLVVVLPKSAILKAYHTFPSIDRYGRLIAEEIIKMMQYRIESLLFLSAKKRYQEVLNREKNLVNRISLTQLSSYLGIERQTLTRIRKDLILQN